MFPSDAPWKSANITLIALSMDDFKDSTEPFEEFSARLEAGFEKAAAWLLARPKDALEIWREEGYQADIFVGGWIDGDQIDLVFPPSFLFACGQAGLAITICTND